LSLYSKGTKKLEFEHSGRDCSQGHINSQSQNSLINLGMFTYPYESPNISNTNSTQKTTGRDYKLLIFSNKYAVGKMRQPRVFRFLNLILLVFNKIIILLSLHWVYVLTHLQYLIVLQAFNSAVKKTLSDLALPLHIVKQSCYIL
jgi:hypothetical protein